MIPYYPSDDTEETYEVVTYWEHLVSEYTGLTLFEVEDLSIIDYMQFRRDAFISKMNRTEGGREYLENARRLEYVKPDRKNLRNKFGKGGR